MPIYRGAGGSGDATADSSSEALLIRELAIEVQADADAASASAAASASSASDASSSASAASTSASNAATSETNASNSATSAATSATNAANSATAAELAETNAETAQTAAASSASAASSSASAASTSATNAAGSASSAAADLLSVQQIFDNFDDIYLGAKASDPTVDNDGNALAVGAVYFNTTEEEIRFYNGTVWERPEYSASQSALAAQASATSASGSATAASGSASAASTSATNAASSATAAQTAETAAELAETNAETAETNAAASASAASSSASSASTSATNASNSASAAATSATNASNSATSASTSASSASTSATAASGSASSASTSASNASTSETNAASSASSASTSASTATTQAGIATTQAGLASTSASNAATSETNAAASASTATTQATNASNSASAAATSATNASNSASAAATSETNAANSATTAASYTPSQTGNSGKFLTTNGTATSWAAVDALPSQTGNSGKYLTTNGTAASWEAVSTPLSSVFRNRIINGHMVIDQRNAGASVTQTTGIVYTVDRWRTIGSVTSKFTVQQNAGLVTPPAGFRNYLRVTSSAATTPASGDSYRVEQAIEGYNIADLDFGTANAKTITASFWVRSSLTGTFGGALWNVDATRAYVFSYTISAADTWEYKTVTIAGDTSGTWNSVNGQGLVFQFSIGAGSNNLATAGSWGSTFKTGVTGQVNVVGTSGATFYITGVQLEAGSVATSFDYENFSVTLQKCQRYYCKTFATGTAPAQNIGAAGSIGFISQAVQPWDAMWRFPVEMRVLPSTIVTFSTNQAGANWSLNTDAPTATPLNIGSSGLAIRASTPGAAGRGYSLHATASAEL
jgi:hypothetical protein